MSTESPLISRTDAEADAAPVRHGSQRHWAMIGFVALSLLVTISIGQLEVLQQGSLRYWLIIIPAVLFPLLDLRAIVATLCGRAWLLLAYLLWAGGWHFFRGDISAVVHLCALVLGMTWISTPRAQINVRDLTRLYLLLVVVGLLMKVFSDLNRYGIVPGYSDPDFGVWRVSFFPNIAYSATLSLVLVLVLSRTRASIRQHSIVFAVASYFLVFSQVRAALIAVVIYAALYLYFAKDEAARPKRMFWTALVVAFGVPMAVFWSADLLYALQHNRVVSAFFLRGETNLSTNDILYQLYRPWLWGAHFKLLLSSPAWMGWGSPEFYQSALDSMKPPQSTTGSESLPTRLVASYGIAGLLFTLYLVRLLRESAQKDDRWACACFPAVFFLMVNWGGIFHPANAMFVLLLLTMTRGSDGFLSELTSASQPTARQEQCDPPPSSAPAH